MSIILKRMTKDGWFESFGDTFMTMLEGASMLFEIILALFIILFALALLIAVPILILRLARALHKRWYDTNQPKQGSDEEVVMGTIASDGNEQDVEYGFVATDNAVEEVDERKEEMDGTGRII